MSPVSTAKRLYRIVAVLVLLLLVGGVGELLRRHWDREQELRIRRALVHARSTGGSPSQVEPDWPELAESLRSRLDSDPDGSLARLALGASARVSLSMPRSFALSDRPRVPVVYGDRDPDEIPLPERPYLWVAIIEGAWNRGPWSELGRGSWGRGGAETGEIDLASAVPDEVSVPGWATLRVRMLLRLYTDDRANVASAATSPEELEAVPFAHQERRSLSGFRVNILDR